MWNIPVSLIAGGSETLTTITSDTLIGNLWTFFGSPAGPQAVVLTIDGADVGDIQVTADWTTGTTFQFNCINGGRILGLGGAGGDGASDFGASTENGVAGGDGGSALSSNGFAINVDIDDGYLLGGGGGGGGGAGADNGATAEAGGGGGGGAGFSVTSGGSAGASIGLPPALDGNDGGPAGAGLGGDGADVGVTDGGDGGGWGTGGTTGDSTDIGAVRHRGGVGGTAGQAFLPTNGATITYNGAKTEATLISESRLIGETDTGYPELAKLLSANAGGGGFTEEGAWRFVAADGNLIKEDSVSVNTTYTAYWYAGTGSPTGADFDVRLTFQYEEGWTTSAAAINTWVSLSSDRVWEMSVTGPTANTSHFEIRRNSDSRLLTSGWMNLSMLGP
jgi:hypothetical protein